MTQTKNSPALLKVVPFLEGAAFVLLALYAVTVCPLLLSMTRSEEAPASWQASLVLSLRWYWALPISVALAVLTIWIARRLSEKAAAVFCAAVSLVLLACGLLLTWALLSA